MDAPSFHLPKSLFIRKLLSRPAKAQYSPLSGFYNLMRYLIVSISLILVTPLHADEGYYFLAGIGESTTRIKSEYLLNNVGDTYENLDFQLSLGYQFNNNLLLELSHISRGSILNFLLPDSVSVYENIALLGYRHHFNEKFSVTPRLGYSSWEVESSEGGIFNSEPETASKKGSDLTYMLSVSYNILYMTFQSTEYDFGSLNSIIIGVDFKL